MAGNETSAPPTSASPVPVSNAARRIVPSPSQSTLVGYPKAGLRMALEEEPHRLVLRGRADPLLLYVVFGAALVVTVGGAILVSPAYGLAGVLLFSALFAPLLIFSALGAMRLRALCVLDRAGQRIEVREQWYAGSLAREWPLSSLQGVCVTTRPPTAWSSSGPTYELHLLLETERYLAAVKRTERSLRRDAQRIGRFVGVPLSFERLEHPKVRITPRDIVLIVSLFALPVVVAAAGLAVLFGGQLPTGGQLIISLVALVMCQVGVILAYLYGQTRIELRRPTR